MDINSKFSGSILNFRMWAITYLSFSMSSITNFTIKGKIRLNSFFYNSILPQNYFWITQRMNSSFIVRTYLFSCGVYTWCDLEASVSPRWAEGSIIQSRLPSQPKGSLLLGGGGKNGHCILVTQRYLRTWSQVNYI